VQVFQDDGTDVDEETGEQLLAAANYHIRKLDLPAWEIVKLPGEVIYQGDDGLVVLAAGTPLIEVDLRAPLIGFRGVPLDDVELQAKVDVVMRHRATGKIWLIDWKSTALAIDTLIVPPFLEHDYQLLIARIVLAHNGIDIDVAALCHLRSQAPEPPPLAYAGKKNQRTSYDTGKLLCDWETYRATLVERGEDPSNPAALKVKEGLARQVFVRWQHDISGDVARMATLAEVTRAAIRMREITRGETQPIRRLKQVPRSGCTRCDYEKWCRAALRNGGVPDLSLLGTDYLANDNSRLAGQEQYGPQFNPSKAYVDYAAQHGRTLESHQEFTP
jgi:hypothetical protein